MKIIKPTFEDVLEQLEHIYIRVDSANGERRLVAGGIAEKGIWIEFAVKIEREASLTDIVQCLEIMVYLIQEEDKHWEIENIITYSVRSVFVWIETATWRVTLVSTIERTFYTYLHFPKMNW